MSLAGANQDHTSGLTRDIFTNKVIDARRKLLAPLRRSTDPFSNVMKLADHTFLTPFTLFDSLIIIPAFYLLFKTNCLLKSLEILTK
jgi:hypothetical protein